MIKRILLITSFVAACDGPVAPPPVINTDPCAPKGACEVAGADLVIDLLEPVMVAGQKIDGATHLAVVQESDSVSVRYRVRNRGDANAPAATAWLIGCDGCNDGGVEVKLRALAPGEVDSAIVRVPAGNADGGEVQASPRMFLNAADEPFYKNNERVASSRFLLVGASLSGYITLLSPEVRFGQPLKFIVTVTNISRYGILPDTTMSFCFRNNYQGYGLDTCNRQFAKYAFPKLGPGETRYDTIDVMLTHEKSYYEKHAAIPVELSGCIGGVVRFIGAKCAAGVNVTLLPDVESQCSVPSMPVNTDVAGDFGTPCYTYLGQYNVWYIDAVAGRTYTVNVTHDTTFSDITVGFWDRNGVLRSTEGNRTATFTPTANGRYYIVVKRQYSTGNYLYTLRLANSL